MARKLIHRSLVLATALLLQLSVGHAQCVDCDEPANCSTCCSATCDTAGTGSIASSLLPGAGGNHQHLDHLFRLPGWCAPWRVDAGVFLLDRSDADPLPLIRDQNSGTPLLDARDLDTGTSGFPYIRLIHEDLCTGWDIGFMGGDSWHDERTVGGPESPLFVGAGLVIPSSSPGATFDVNYGTDLYMFDVNYRHRLSHCLTGLVGFRWIELSDEITIVQNQGGTNPVLQTDTNNHLYGLQVGLDALLLDGGPNWRLESTFRAAIMANHADQNTFAPYVSNVPGFVDSVTADSDDTAFFAGWGVQGLYRLSSRLSAVAGYQLFWIEQVALAPAQIPLTNLAVPATADIDNNSGLFFSGANIGLSYTY